MNLQGFPDFFPPDYVRDALVAAVKSDNPFMQQYTRSYVSIVYMINTLHYSGISHV